MSLVKTLAVIALLFLAVGAFLFYETTLIDVSIGGFSFRMGPKGEQLMDVDTIVSNGGVIGGALNITGSKIYIDGKLAAVLYKPSTLKLEPGSTTNVTLTYKVVDAKPILGMLARRSAMINVTVDSQLLVGGYAVSLPTQTRAGRITLSG